MHSKAAAWSGDPSMTTRDPQHYDPSLPGRVQSDCHSGMSGHTFWILYSMMALQLDPLGSILHSNGRLILVALCDFLSADSSDCNFSYKDHPAGLTYEVPQRLLVS